MVPFPTTTMAKIRIFKQFLKCFFNNFEGLADGALNKLGIAC